jgi:hypothetical protein
MMLLATGSREFVTSAPAAKVYGGWGFFLPSGSCFSER